jgi:hypothetical protein
MLPGLTRCSANALASGLRLRIPFAGAGPYRPGDGLGRSCLPQGRELSNRVGSTDGSCHRPNDAAAAHSLPVAFGLGARSTAVSERTVTDERAHQMGDELRGSGSFGRVSSALDTLEAVVEDRGHNSFRCNQPPYPSSVIPTVARRERTLSDDRTLRENSAISWFSISPQSPRNKQPGRAELQSGNRTHNYFRRRVLLHTRIYPVGTFLQTGRLVSANGRRWYLGHSPSLL